MADTTPVSAPTDPGGSFGEQLATRSRPRLAASIRIRRSSAIGAVGRSSLGFGRIVATAGSARPTVTPDVLATRSLRLPMGAWTLFGADQGEPEPESGPVPWTTRAVLPELGRHTPAGSSKFARSVTPAAPPTAPAATARTTAPPASKVDRLRQMLEAQGIFKPSQPAPAPADRSSESVQRTAAASDRSATRAGPTTAPGQFGRRVRPESTAPASPLSSVFPEAAPVPGGSRRSPAAPKVDKLDRLRQMLESQGVIESADRPADRAAADRPAGGRAPSERPTGRRRNEPARSPSQAVRAPRSTPGPSLSTGEADADDSRGVPGRGLPFALAPEVAPAPTRGQLRRSIADATTARMPRVGPERGSPADDTRRPGTTPTRITGTGEPVDTIDSHTIAPTSSPSAAAPSSLDPAVHDGPAAAVAPPTFTTRTTPATDPAPPTSTTRATPNTPPPAATRSDTAPPAATPTNRPTSTATPDTTPPATAARTSATPDTTAPATVARTSATPATTPDAVPGMRAEPAPPTFTTRTAPTPAQTPTATPAISAPAAAPDSGPTFTTRSRPARPVAATPDADAATDTAPGTPTITAAPRLAATTEAAASTAASLNPSPVGDQIRRRTELRRLGTRIGLDRTLTPHIRTDRPVGDVRPGTTTIRRSPRDAVSVMAPGTVAPGSLPRAAASSLTPGSPARQVPTHTPLPTPGTPGAPHDAGAATAHTAAPGTTTPALGAPTDSIQRTPTPQFAPSDTVDTVDMVREARHESPRADVQRAAAVIDQALSPTPGAPTTPTAVAAARAAPPTPAAPTPTTVTSNGHQVGRATPAAPTHREPTASIVVSRAPDARRATAVVRRRMAGRRFLDAAPVEAAPAVASAVQRRGRPESTAALVGAATVGESHTGADPTRPAAPRVPRSIVAPGPGALQRALIAQHADDVPHLDFPDDPAPVVTQRRTEGTQTSGATLDPRPTTTATTRLAEPPTARPAEQQTMQHAERRAERGRAGDSPTEVPSERSAAQPAARRRADPGVLADATAAAIAASPPPVGAAAPSNTQIQRSPAFEDTAPDRRAPEAAPPIDLGERFLRELGRAPDQGARELPIPFQPLATAITGSARQARVSSDEVSRKALESVGKRAVTVGDTIHIARTPRSDAETREVIAHELVHVAHPSPVPRFFDDDHRGPEERMAEQVAQVIARSPVMPSAPMPSQPAARPGSTTIRRSPAAGSSSTTTSRTTSGGSGGRSGPSSGSFTAAELADAIEGRATGTIQRRIGGHRARGRTTGSSSSSSSSSGSWHVGPSSSQPGPDDGAPPEGAPEPGRGAVFGSGTREERAWFERLIEQSIDRVVRRVEERVIIDLERRGGRFWRSF